MTSSAQTIERVNADSACVGHGERFGVIIYDNDTNTVDEVVEVLIRATKCAMDEAVMEMWEAHTYGKAWVHFSTEDECRRIAEIIERIGVTTTVRKEWD